VEQNMLKSRKRKDACLISRYVEQGTSMNTRGNRMTKVSSLVCTATALLLTFGMAMAEDSAQNEQAKPAVTDNAGSQPAPPEDQSKPKEVTADPAPSQDNAAKSQKEPGCD
jgi:hypothetical protein